MTSILVQQKVKDFAMWKKAYDSMASLRASKGAISDMVFHDAGDKNKVTVILNWDSLDKAKNYAQSPELKEAMMEAGVEGPPQITFLNAA
jgi:heme-degrading monooxygenase HmoA